MNRNIRFYILSLFFILFGLSSSMKNACYGSAPAAITIHDDTLKRQTRTLSPQEAAELLTDSDYRYDRDDGPQPLSIWDRFWEWFASLFDKASGTRAGPIAFDVVQYVILVAAIVALILLLLKNNIRSLFSRKSAVVPVSFTEMEQDIHSISFDTLIDEAVANKDFRKAVRLRFLKVLKELTDKELITWQIDKTNNDYLKELSSSGYHKDFRLLALLYEYVWYGDFQLNEESYQHTVEQFKQFQVT